jgi:site-specific recombinase XerD
MDDDPGRSSVFFVIANDIHLAESLERHSRILRFDDGISEAGGAAVQNRLGLLAGVQQRQDARDCRRITFTDALKDVITDQEVNERRAIDATKRRIDKHIAPHFEGRRIGEINTTQIRRYIEQRKKASAQPATINRELAIIRRAFRLAYRAGQILTTGPHIELLDESRNVRQGIIEPHDFAKVLTKLEPGSYAAAAEAAFITGWRLRSEILTLTWGQVDTKAGLIRMDVGQSKGGEGRTFPITARLRAIVGKRRLAYFARVEAASRRRDENPPVEALLFAEDDGTAIHYKRFYATWGEAVSAAGFPDLIPHDLRRSAVREIERRQIPRQVSMKLIGHRTESIFRRYAIVQEADIRDAGARLDQKPAKASRAATRA